MICYWFVKTGTTVWEIIPIIESFKSKFRQQPGQRPGTSASPSETGTRIFIASQTAAPAYHPRFVNPASTALPAGLLPVLLLFDLMREAY